MNQQGQAMVEFAVLMLAFVPLMLYVVFLSDVSYNQFEVQETVISTTWDFSTRNQETSSSSDADSNRTNEASNVGKLNRLEYMDHTSSFDDGAEGDNSDDYSKLSQESANSHNQLAARSSWIGQNGNNSVDDSSSDYDTDDSSQVTCTINKQDDLDWIVAGLGSGVGTVVPAYQFGQSKFSKGGLATCWAKAWIYNFLIPEKFMQDQASVDLTQKKLQTGNATDIKGQNGTTSNILVRDRAAISFDTWAIVNGANDDKIQNADLDVGTSTDSDDNPFFARGEAVYGNSTALGAAATTLTYGYMALRVGQFSLKGLSENIAIIPSFPAVKPYPLGVISESGPANIDAFYLVARYKNGDTSRNDLGYDEQCAVADDAACLAGPKYESTPFQNFDSNSKYKSTFQKRTLHYLGCQDPYKC
jgi:Flp pilus assembly protein TadG